MSELSMTPLCDVLSTPHVDPVVGRVPPAAAVSLEAIEAAVADAAGADSATAVIDARPAPASERLAMRLGKRYLTVQAEQRAWQACASLAAGGARPLLLISQAQFFDAAAALAAMPAATVPPATAIVFGHPARTLKRYDERMGGLPQAVIAAASDLPALRRLLAFSLAHEGLMMICTPATSPRNGAQRRLRIDPAESNWLRRQRRAGLIEHGQIVEKQFSADLAPWIAGYERVGTRPGYIWKWCLHGVELTTLSCVTERLRGAACDTKVLGGMLNVLIDDVADQQGNDALLAALRRLVHGGDPAFETFPPEERRYGEFTRQVWAELWRRSKRFPCYDPYASLLEFDMAQLCNTVHYSHLVNRNPYILNVVEHDDYSPQGMGLLSFAMIDLMCSPQFVANELGKLREAMWHAQWMARIGNLITTWQREIGDRDYSSGVFARAVARRDLTIDELLSSDRARIMAAIDQGGHEAFFLRRWRQHRAHLERLMTDVRSVDLGAMLHGLQRLLRTELVSRGHK